MNYHKIIKNTINQCHVLDNFCKKYENYLCSDQIRKIIKDSVQYTMKKYKYSLSSNNYDYVFNKSYHIKSFLLRHINYSCKQQVKFIRTNSYINKR